MLSPSLLDLMPAPAADGSLDEDAAFDAFAGWAQGRGLALYPAQEEAMIEIVSGANVILSTPTGTGKSLVAIGAHAHALARGGRSYYTAPIKALVSEKFFALVEIFGAERVGMVTGDSSVNPDAPIICCTAEILTCGARRPAAGQTTRPTAWALRAKALRKWGLRIHVFRVDDSGDRAGATPPWKPTRPRGTGRGRVPEDEAVRFLLGARDRA